MVQALTAVQSGEGIKQSAKAFGIPYTSLYTRVKATEISSSKDPPKLTLSWDEDVMAQARLAVRRGDSIMETARAFNIPYTTLHGRVKKSQRSEPSPQPRRAPTPQPSPPAPEPAMPLKHTPTWTEDEMAAAITAFQNGEGIKASAGAHGIPITTLRKRLLKQSGGWFPRLAPPTTKPERTWTDEAMAKAVSAVHNGQTVKDASEAFGVPHGVLYNSLHKQLPPLPKRPMPTWTEDDMASAIIAVQKGQSLKTAAITFNIPYTSLFACLRKIPRPQSSHRAAPAKDDQTLADNEKKPNRVNYTEYQVDSALEAWDNGESLAIAAEKWGVPLSTLNRFRKHRHDYSTSSENGTSGPLGELPGGSPGPGQSLSQGVVYTETDVQHALEAMADGDRLIVTAKRWGVPKSVLRHERSKLERLPSPVPLENRPPTLSASRPRELLVRSRRAPNKKHDATIALENMADGMPLLTASRVWGIPEDVLRQRQHEISLKPKLMDKPMTQPATKPFHGSPASEDSISSFPTPEPLSANGTPERYCIKGEKSGFVDFMDDTTMVEDGMEPTDDEEDDAWELTHHGEEDAMDFADGEEEEDHLALIQSCVNAVVDDYEQGLLGDSSNGAPTLSGAGF
ncbi:hypothetical protein F5X68DRAFT_274914 [Plectosphaerella plurivora]|uniref:HTH psq-type domain-containing protein n=1 Tax=Plectosphaerella plurivora TaxID=936078 RepID=A0A9P9AEL7_9PEZI|nr:hypothetical protein F5X68DRAFT_274914 [Plectosphaerella plurivora]